MMRVICGIALVEGALLLTWKGLIFRSWSVPSKDGLKREVNSHASLY